MAHRAASSSQTATSQRVTSAGTGGVGRTPVIDRIRIRGARTHNLKNIDLDIPRDQLVVLTGPSGSGKSSLAFDTLYAEGQRQYIESLSVYARQFLDQMERPDVDFIDGLQPTLCIDQRPANVNPRSTLGTLTELYDYLRLMMARLGDPSCYQCGASIRQQTPGQIQEAMLRLGTGSKLMVLAPVVRGRRGQHRELLEQLRTSGFVRARIDGQVYDVDNLPELSARKVHHIEAVVDRIVIREGIESRLGESIRLAVRQSDGLVIGCHLPPDTPTQSDQWSEELYSTRYACPTCQINYEEVEPRTFSFNSPYGACPQCEGLGRLEEFDPQRVVPDVSMSIDGGAVAAWKGAAGATVRKNRELVAEFLKSKRADLETPLQDLRPRQFEQLLHGDERSFLGILVLLEKEFATSSRQKRLQQLQSFRSVLPCSSCLGSRLRQEANSVRLDGKTIHEICSLPISASQAFFHQLSFPEHLQQVSTPILGEINRRIDFLMQVGVGYLTINRAADTLSGGELQRVRLATGIGSGLVGVCYILDEPSIGLHPRDNQKLIGALRNLQQQGNTVVVVEHDEAVMLEADRLIDIGPGAGEAGGRIMAHGTPQEVCQEPESITGRYLRGDLRIAVPDKRRRFAKTRSLTIEGVTTNNLKDVTVRFPMGVLICVTGVSGSGKSSLINETLCRSLQTRLGGGGPQPGPHTSLRGVNLLDKIIPIDQSPIGRSPRSNAATYTGAFDEIRKVFAATRESRQRGFTASRFSFNAKGGRCESCQGQGLQKIEMNFLSDLYVTCPECNGTRYNHQTLEVPFRGRNIAQVLEMSVTEGLEFFENFVAIHRLLRSLNDVGLGYLKLAQHSTTLSGGEAQRIKLATQLARQDTGKTLYVLDEPTTGLHFDDIRRLLDVLAALVDRGNTVIVIEHNLDVIKCADWIIDLGPEGGDAGGFVIAEGTPEDIAVIPDNATGQSLATVLQK